MSDQRNPYASPSDAPKSQNESSTEQDATQNSTNQDGTNQDSTSTEDPNQIAPTNRNPTLFRPAPVHDPNHQPRGLVGVALNQRPKEIISEAKVERDTYLRNETTIRALAVAKLWTVLGFVSLAGYVFFNNLRLSQLMPPSWTYGLLTTDVRPGTLASFLIGIAAGHGMIALMLHWLQPSGRALQGCISIMMMMFSLVTLFFSSMAMFGSPFLSIRLIVFGTMLLLAVHMIYLILMFSRGANHVFTEEYWDAIADTPDTNFRKYVAIKLIWLTFMWFMGIGGSALIIQGILELS